MTLTAAQSVSEALAEGRARLRAAGIESAALDAELLLAEALGCERPALLLGGAQRLPGQEAAAYRAMLDRRARREPVARILGRREFWSLSFAVSDATLVPRPDSETLVEAALARLTPRERPWRLLDLGTGSGCLLISLLKELPAATGLGTDISSGALATARRNAESLGLGNRASFAEGDWLAAVLEERFDVVTSNPPYIESEEFETLMPEVAEYEPRVALDGGRDGLAAYRRLAAEAPARLRPGGWLLLEVGAGQAPAVEALLAEAGLEAAPARCDLGGCERVVGGRRPHAHVQPDHRQSE